MLEMVKNIKDSDKNMLFLDWLSYEYEKDDISTEE